MTDSKKKLKWRRKRTLSESERASRVATGREIEEYLLYLRSPWRVMGVNFIAGIMRGLGAAVGATAVIALAVWLVTKTAALPVIGEYFTDMRDNMNELIEEARFADDFRRVERVLRRIESHTADSLAIQVENAAATVAEASD